MLIYNSLQLSSGKRALWLGISLPLPALFFFLYYLYSIPRIKENPAIGRTLQIEMLRLDMITSFIIALFMFQAVLLLVLVFKKRIKRL